MSATPPQTRIQQRNRTTILEAALDMFSRHGFRGTTLDQIASQAGLSKPNLLYYFKSKEAIHRALLESQLKTWLDPLRTLSDTGDPIEEILAYVLLKLDMARALPRESRLFAMEIIQGAPRIMDEIKGPLKDLVDEKAALIAQWSAQGRIAPIDPYHLIFSIWATTQHYADFDAQICGILGFGDDARFDEAKTFLTHLFRKTLQAD